MALRLTERGAGIRPLQRADIGDVAAIVASQFPASNVSSRGLVEFLEQTLFDHPWADPELPSLAYVDDGRIVGMIASSTRRMVFEGRPIRCVCSAHLWAHPSARSRGIGARLLQALLAGPQDLTITDSASDVVRRMWEAFGGRTVHLSGLSFIRAFRPWSMGADLLLYYRPSGIFTRALRSASSTLDRASIRIAPAMLRPRKPEGIVERLTPAAMVEHLPLVTSSLRLYGDYDRLYLEWLFDHLDGIDRHQLPWLRGRVRERGRLWAELVRKDETALGWYVCHFSGRGYCRVLQIAATPRGVDTVIDNLYHRAWQSGAIAVLGRMEPHVVPSVSRLPRDNLVASSGQFLIHARDESITDAILTGDTLVTRLDGEWWVSP